MDTWNFREEMDENLDDTNSLEEVVKLSAAVRHLVKQQEMDDYPPPLLG